MLTRKSVILAKVESSYGSDSTPVAATDAILCSEPQIKPIGKRLERDNIRASISPLQPIIIGEMYEITFVTEIKGSGTAGTAPEIAPLFLGCGMAETVVASTSVAYDPVSSSFDSLSIYFYRDGILHKILGARGDLQAVVESSEYGKISWTFQGIYAGPADVSLVSGTYNAILPPICVASTFTMGSYTPVARKVEVGLNNALGRRDDITQTTGLKEIIITRRDTKGSFDPESVLVTTKNFWSEWNASTAQALSCIIGVTAGNIYEISGPKCVFDDLSYGDRDGNLTLEIPFTMAMDTGDDEQQFKFT